MATPQQPGGPPDPTQPTEALPRQPQPGEPRRGAVPPPPPPGPRTPRAGVAPPAVAPPVVQERPPIVQERVPPPYPPEEPGNPWAAFTVGLIALLLGGVIGYAVGNNNGSGTEHASRTVTQVHTVVQPKVVTNTVTSKTVTQAPPNPANEQRRVEAEANLHKLEKENEELRRQSEAG